MPKSKLRSESSWAMNSYKRGYSQWIGSVQRNGNEMLRSELYLSDALYSRAVAESPLSVPTWESPQCAAESSQGLCLCALSTHDT